MRIATAALVVLLLAASGCGGGGDGGGGTTAATGARQPQRVQREDRVREQPRTATTPTTAATTPTAAATTPTTAQTRSDRYLAQLGSFRSRDNAEADAADLRARGIHAAVLRSDAYVELRPGYWVVYVGFFDDIGGAQAAAAHARASGTADAFARHVTYDVTR